MQSSERRLTWPEIKNLYPNEWVELVDYEWDETEPDPRAGAVRAHSKDRKERKEFEELIRYDPPSDSALLYVGRVVFREGTTPNSNQNQFAKP